MPYSATRKALIGGDANTWGAFQQGMDKLHIGANTIEAYISAGALYLSAGMMGLYDGSQDWNVTNSAAAAVSVAGLTVSCWAQLEISAPAGVPTILLTSIGGATNPASLPASFTGAYDGTKGGFYITGTKRCHSLVWINAAGVPEGCVNTIGGCDGYSGYGQSDDANDYIYSFLKIGNTDSNRILRLAAKNIIDVALWASVGIEMPSAIFCEEQNAGTQGGTFTSGADRTRVLNTTLHNTIAGASLAANVITLPAGKYRIRWSAPANQCDSHHSWLANNAGGAILTDIGGNNCISQASYTVAAHAIVTCAEGEYVISLLGSTGIILNHRCTTTAATNGFGVAANLTYKERYSIVWVTKIG
jgi:hypothetical protein